MSFFKKRTKSRCAHPQSANAKRSQGTIVHALHKSGSMFLYKFFRDIARRQGTPFHSVNNKPCHHQTVGSEVAEDFILCPIRNLDIGSFEFEKMDDIHHIVQVRDPRDILVSEYFSRGWQHTTVGWTAEDFHRREMIQQVSIDEFVVNEHLYNKRSLLDRYQPVLGLVRHARVTIVKYETMILDFHRWLDQVLATPGMPNGSRLKRKLLCQYRQEFVPDNQHRRRVIPGDHRDKLSPESIAAINVKFKKIFRQLGYEQADRSGLVVV